MQPPHLPPDPKRPADTLAGMQAAIREVLAQADVTWRNVAKSIDMEMLRLVWHAASATTNCFAKLQQAFRQLHDSAKSAHGQFGDVLDAHAAEQIAAAWVVAQAHGCTVEQVVADASKTRIDVPLWQSLGAIARPIQTVPYGPPPPDLTMHPGPVAIVNNPCWTVNGGVATNLPIPTPVAASATTPLPHKLYPIGVSPTNSPVSMPVGAGYDMPHLPPAGGGHGALPPDPGFGPLPPDGGGTIINWCEGPPHLPPDPGHGYGPPPYLPPPPPPPPGGCCPPNPINITVQPAQVVVMPCCPETPPPPPPICDPCCVDPSTGMPTDCTPVPPCPASLGVQFPEGFITWPLPIIDGLVWTDPATGITYDSWGCPVNDESHCEVDCGFKIPKLTFSIPDFCSADGCTDAQSVADGIGGNIDNVLKWILPPGFMAGSTDIAKMVADWLKGRDLLEQGILYFPALIWTAAASLIRAIVPDDKACPITNGLQVNAAIAIFSAVNRWIGGGMEKQVERLRQFQDFMCPTRIPSQGDADMLGVRKAITKDTWTCWTKANNNCPDPAFDIMLQGRSRIGISDCIRMWMRGEWDDNRVKVELGYRGVYYDNEKDQFKTLSKFIPGTSDLVRFMVRDVFDPAVVRAYQLDADFATKFQGDAVAIATANGVDRDTMLKYWESHWVLPSPTQGYEMFHRLRPGRVPAGQVCTQADLKTLLQTADMAPGWVDRMIAIARPVLRLVDIRRSYFQGVIDFAEMVEQFQDRGYTLANATIVANSVKAARIDWLKNRKWFREWIAGGSNDTTAFNRATGDGVSPADWPLLLVQRDYEVSVRKMLICTKAIHKRYLFGELDDAQAANALVGIGQDLNTAIELVREWACEKQARGRGASAAQLGTFAQRGLLSHAQHRQRLEGLGYSAEDAGRIAGIALSRAEEQAARGSIRLAEQRKKEQAKREADEARRQLSRSKSRTLKHASSANRAARDERAMLRWTRSASAIAAATGESPADVRDYLAGEMSALMDGLGWSATTASELIADQAKAVRQSDRDTWRATLRATIDALESASAETVLEGSPT